MTNEFERQRSSVGRLVQLQQQHDVVVVVVVAVAGATRLDNEQRSLAAAAS